MRMVFDMKRKAVIIIASVMLVAGLALVLFPPLSNFIGRLIANSETGRFDSQVANAEDGSYSQAVKDKKVDKQGYPVGDDGKRTSDTRILYKVDIERLYKDSIKYNENLKENQNSLLTNQYSYTKSSLDLTKYGIFDGIYGYVSAPSIDMKLPIYLGANASTMSYGAAHLTYTSLPLGGKNTNTVLAGHTGYVGRIFFDNLRNLKISDRVTVTNYWSTLKYKVIQTKVLKPSESQDIFIKNNKDLLTMITCISNGNGGFNRYFVICERE